MGAWRPVPFWLIGYRRQRLVQQGAGERRPAEKILPFDDYAFYLVWPKPFMRDIFAGVRATGVDIGRIHFELFGPASA